MKSLYSSLLEYYDELFPVEKNRLDFVEAAAVKYQKANGAGGTVKILDIGCATGTTALQLMRRGMDVTGIDNNDAMIQSANRRNPEPKTNARFFLMDMAGITEYFAPGAFDMILCLGNTLAHLDNLREIEAFIRSAGTLLRKGGIFIFQIINYDRVLSENIRELPPVETARSSFIRKYSRTKDGHILFEGTVLSSSGQPAFVETATLYPLTLKELTRILDSGGFTDEYFCSDFDGAPLEKSSLAVVGTAARGN